MQGQLLRDHAAIERGLAEARRLAVLIDDPGDRGRLERDLDEIRIAE